MQPNQTVYYFGLSFKVISSENGLTRIRDLNTGLILTVATRDVSPN